MGKNNKKEKLAVSISIVGSVVAVILFIVIGYQMATMFHLKEMKAEYEKLLQERVVMLENGEKDLDYYHSNDYLRRLANTYGFYFPEDKVE